MKILITGDTHGQYGRMLEFIRELNAVEDKEKYLLVAGDFGYLFENSFMERKILDEMERQDFTIVVVPGNHENYTEFQKFEIVDFHGAKAHKVRKNIFYICRGEIFELGGKAFFCMSGGNSVDKYMRKKNVSWWEEEMPTDEELKYANKNIEKHRESGKKIDYIISHTVPLSTLEYLGKSHGTDEKPLNNYLEYVREILKTEYTMHFCGHLHMDKELPELRQRILWFDYVEIDTKGDNL